MLSQTRRGGLTGHYHGAMQTPAVLRRAPGPLERTAAELEHIRRTAAFRRGREQRSRRHLRETDLILEVVEQCRLRDIPLVPARLWMHVVRLAGEVDADLRDELGINRTVDHVGEVVFRLQGRLLDRAAEPPVGPAVVIPLFPAAATV